jgi:hypothetical protein
LGCVTIPFGSRPLSAPLRRHGGNAHLRDFLAGSWPVGIPRSRIYNDKRALVPGPPYSSLHAKCVVVDGGRSRQSASRRTSRDIFDSMSDKNWEPLGAADKEWIATEIHHLLPSLRKDKRRRAWAYALIDELLWFWTADAVHPEGHVKRDAIKYDPRYLHHTDAALRSLTEGVSTKDEKVQHEHAGERVEIIEILENHGKTARDVVDILETLNVAVLVTKREHQALGKRAWNGDWNKRKWDAHYKAKSLVVHPPRKA